MRDKRERARQLGDAYYEGGLVAALRLLVDFEAEDRELAGLPVCDQVGARGEKPVDVAPPDGPQER